MLWDWHSWAALSARHVELARASGALAPLSIALNGRGVFAAWCGDLEAVAALLAEDSAIKDVIGSQWFSAAALLHAGYRGRPEEDLAFISASAADLTSRGQARARRSPTGQKLSSATVWAGTQMRWRRQSWRLSKWRRRIK
jgi:hypothetical protein